MDVQCYLEHHNANQKNNNENISSGYKNHDTPTNVRALSSRMGRSQRSMEGLEDSSKVALPAIFSQKSSIRLQYEAAFFSCFPCSFQNEFITSFHRVARV
jgi:hypothetical protein